MCCASGLDSFRSSFSSPTTSSLLSSSSSSLSSSFVSSPALRRLLPPDGGLSLPRNCSVESSKGKSTSSSYSSRSSFASRSSSLVAPVPAFRSRRSKSLSAQRRPSRDSSKLAWKVVRHLRVFGSNITQPLRFAEMPTKMPL